MGRCRKRRKRRRKRRGEEKKNQVKATMAMKLRGKKLAEMMRGEWVR